MASGEAMTARLLCVAPNPSIDRLIQVDRLLPGTIHRPTLVQAVAGGKGFNVARAAAALGGSVTAVGILAGHGGRWLAEALEMDGVAGRFAWTDGETRICTSIADAETGQLTEIYEAGPIVTTDAWEAFERTVADALAAGEVDAMTISGSLPPGAPGDGQARLIGLARSADVPVAIDGFGDAWADVLAAGPWLVKANAAEASVYTGSPRSDAGEALTATAAMVEAGASGAIVTLGAAGAVASLEGSDWTIGPPSGRGAYPVGSGDAFLAGVVVGSVEGLGAAASLALGAGAGAANAQVAGAGILDGSLARSLAATIEVTRIG